MRPIVVSILAALLVAGCSAAPAASPPPVPASPSPIPPPAFTAAPSAGPSPSAPVVGPAPSGPWSSVAWLRAGRLQLDPAPRTIQGWSGGYVAFEQSVGSDDNGNPTPVVIRVSSSTDGTQWSLPETIETGFEGSIAITSIVEGPAGLLAQAFARGAACGGPPTLFALWTSADGQSWQRVPMPKGFTSGSVEQLAGGPAGFIALGKRGDGVTQAIWTSSDGRTWSARKLPTLSSGTLALDAVASFDGGFVLVGSVLGGEGCGGPSHIKYAAWYSAAGTEWTRANLPGASTDPKAALDIRRIGGNLLVIQRPDTDAPARGWTSPDGRAWTSVGSVAGDAWLSSVSDGSHAVVVLEPDTGFGSVTVQAASPNGAFTTIPQSGDVPSTDEGGGGWRVTVGPTGILLVRNDDGVVYLGVPS